LLDPDGPGWEPQAEALLFAAARSDHVARKILPALEDGKWVICDRFIDSSLAYQGGGGGVSGADLLELHQIGSGGLMPDLTILVEVPPEIAAARLAKRDGGQSDAIGGRDRAYHAKVASAFARLAAADPARFARIDGSASASETGQKILAACGLDQGQSA
jgi:dTMP kinase